ncbi:MAG: D-tyrosyl-tRNA(Tyr) deacylase [Clostridia bacterium]|nr:D-tyrosyl-tRNA(Tyr) deacylase [Clostridia bacterium]
MRFVIQRVSHASVKVEENVVGKIEKGLLVLIGIKDGDTKEIADAMVRKLLKLRIFGDEHGKMNVSIKDVQGELLLVSQFTLYANCRKGNRPDFLDSAKPEYASKLYDYIIEKCKEENIQVQTGIFGADMKVELLNDGPVTIVLNSEEITTIHN